MKSNQCQAIRQVKSLNQTDTCLKVRGRAGLPWTSEPTQSRKILMETFIAELFATVAAKVKATLSLFLKNGCLS